MFFEKYRSMFSFAQSWKLKMNRNQRFEPKLGDSSHGAPSTGWLNPSSDIQRQATLIKQLI